VIAFEAGGRGGADIPPAPVLCTYDGHCGQPATSHVWDETRPGLYVHDDVCPRHLRSALRLGYREGFPPSLDDQPLSEDDAPGEWWADHPPPEI
jgi:hypothetical protein